MTALCNHDPPPLSARLVLYFQRTETDAAIDAESRIDDVVAYLRHFGSLTIEESEEGHQHIVLEAQKEELAAQKDLIMEVLKSYLHNQWSMHTEEETPCQD